MSEKAPMVGLFFVGDGLTGPLAQFQGEIIDDLDDDRWLIQLFSWLDGRATNKRIVSTDDLAGCVLCADEGAWHAEGDRLTAKNTAKNARTSR